MDRLAAFGLTCAGRDHRRLAIEVRDNAVRGADLSVASDRVGIAKRHDELALLYEAWDKPIEAARFHP